MKRAAIWILVGLFGLTAGKTVWGADAPSFATPKQACDAWMKNPDATARKTAFDWLRIHAETCPPKDLPEALAQFGRVASSSGSRDAFLGACAKRGGSEDADVAVRQAVAFALADWHVAAGEPAAAAAALEQFLKPANLPATNRAAAVIRLSALYADSCGRPDEAAALAAASMEAVSPRNDPALYAELANARAAVLQLHLRDVTGAEAECRKVLDLGKACPQPAFIAASERLASILTDSGKTNEAAKALLLVFNHPLPPPAGIARKLIDSGASEAVLQEAVGLLRSRVAGAMASPTDLLAAVEKGQPEIVELLLALGKAEEAVAECRVFALGASDRAYPQAIELAARCLKTLDGHLGRANALLDFHGKNPPAAGTRNPLFEFPALTDAVREEALARTATPASDWTGWINRAAYLSWLDRPVESMDAARSAFACCPMTSNTLQACANAVTRPLLVATRNPETAQKVADYLLTGPAGPDGAVGTTDDMADPFPEVRRLLSYPMVEGRPSAAKAK